MPNSPDNSDLIIAGDIDENGTGDIVFKTRGVERARITSAGVGSRLFVSRQQLMQSAYGVLTDNGPPYYFSTLTALTSQTVYGSLLGLRAGDSVVGIKMRNGVAAAGTAPTTARAGIADANGTILALSGNVGAAATWPVGAVTLPLTTPYSVLADGGYYACVVVDGTWSVTQPTPNRAANIAAGIADGSFATVSFNWTGQTDLPAIGSPLTKTATGSSYYMGFY